MARTHEVLNEQYPANVVQRKRRLKMARQVGDFFLGKRLGVGAFSEVFDAYREDDKSSFAVKVIPRAKLQSGSRQSRMVKLEIQILRTMPPHPNIIALQRVVRSTNSLYIILERAQHGDLFQRVEDVGRMTEDEARPYMQQLVEAVAHCHANGIAHRDLKPENILIGDKDAIKLADFGMSVAWEPGTPEPFARDTVGTSSYMAPEVLERVPYLGSKADIWALGVIFYILLKGAFPFSSVDYEKVLDRIATRDPVHRLHRHSKESRQLLAAMLHRDPALRPTSHQLLSFPWFDSASSEQPNYAMNSFSRDSSVSSLPLIRDAPLSITSN